ncbi:uncharacterized protein LOC115230293 isoform X1 [Argonauta hians]
MASANYSKEILFITSSESERWSNYFQERLHEINPEMLSRTITYYEIDKEQLNQQLIKVIFLTPRTISDWNFNRDNILLLDEAGIYIILHFGISPTELDKFKSMGSNLDIRFITEITEYSDSTENILKEINDLYISHFQNIYEIIKISDEQFHIFPTTFYPNQRTLYLAFNGNLKESDMDVTLKSRPDIMPTHAGNQNLLVCKLPDDCQPGWHTVEVYFKNSRLEPLYSENILIKTVDSISRDIRRSFYKHYSINARVSGSMDPSIFENLDKSSFEKIWQSAKLLYPDHEMFAPAGHRPRIILREQNACDSKLNCSFRTKMFIK